MVERLAVELVYATPGHQEALRLELVPGSTLEQAIRASGLLARHPEIDLAINPVGIFGKPANLTSLLRANDRIEIYRHLLIYPRESRRRRAARKSSRPA